MCVVLSNSSCTERALSSGRNLSRQDGAPDRARLPMSRRCLSTAAGSFMARVNAANDPSVLLGPFTSAGRFDACLERAGMRALSSFAPSCVASSRAPSRRALQ